MAVSRIQDRTVEFQAVVQQAARRQAQAKGGAGATAQKKRSMMLLGSSNNYNQSQQHHQQQQQQPLLSADDYPESGTAAGLRPISSRSEFARRAAEIGRGISMTMAKLERLAQCRLHLRFKMIVWILSFKRNTDRNSGKAKKHV